MKKPDILVSFGAATEQFDRAVAKVKGTAASLGATLSGISAKFGGLFGLGAIVGGAGLANQLRETTQWADNLVNAADRVGQSVENVQTLRLEAEKLGLSTQATDTALQRFARRLAEAQQGTGVLSKEFEKYNIQLTDTQGNFKTTEAVLEEFAAALQGIENAGERARVSMAAFDTEGVKLGQTLATMDGSISATTKRMMELGRVMEEDGIRQAAALETQWTEMTQTMDSKFKSLLISVTSGWQSMMSVFNTGIDYVKDGLTRIPELNKVTAEIIDMEEKIQDIVNRSAIWPLRVNEQRRAKDLMAITLEYDKLLRKREAIIGQSRRERLMEKQAASEIATTVKETSAERTRAVTTANAERVSSTRETVKAEGAYWQAEHDLISALQDDNAKAVEDARDRMKQAIQDMSAAGASDYRVRYYEERGGVSDSDAVPSVTFKPIVDPEGLAQMPKLIQEALNAENFTVTVQPIMATEQTNVLQQTADQSGHDET